MAANRDFALHPTFILLITFVFSVCGAAASVPLGPWQDGRSTFYGPLDGSGGTSASIDAGGCGFGTIARASFPYGLIAAPVLSSALDLYTGNCGKCIEIMCSNATSYYPSGYGNACSQASITVQVTDACPCNYPANQASNTKWCCGDMAHFDLSAQAFSQLAPLSLGYIYTKWRPVSCDFVAGNISIIMDSYTNNWWMAIRPSNIAGTGVLSSVELMEPLAVGDGNWHKMNRSWGATWNLDHHGIHTGHPFKLPLSVRLNSSLGQSVVLPAIIPTLTLPVNVTVANWVYASGVQFPPVPLNSVNFTAAATPASLVNDFTAFVFNDALSPEWSMSLYGGGAFNSSATTQGIAGSTAVRATVNSGGAIAVTAVQPLAPTSTLQFFVRPAVGSTCDVSTLALSLEGPGTNDTIMGITSSMNMLRCTHGGVPPLTWDADLASGAATYAALCTSVPSSGAGTNFSEAGGAYSAAAVSAIEAVAAWGQEEINPGMSYNYQFPGYRSYYADFTSIVWQGSTSVGCGLGACPAMAGGADGPANGALNWQCRFSPPGNVRGVFSLNVLPPNVTNTTCLAAGAANFNARINLGAIGASSTAVYKPDPTSYWARVTVTPAAPMATASLPTWTRFVLQNTGQNACDLLLDDIEILMPIDAQDLSVSL